MWYVLWGMLGWGIAVFPMILGGGNGSGWFLTMLGLVVYVSGFVLIFRHQKSDAFDRAKKVINEMKAKVDVPRMQKLDAEFGGTPQAQRLLGQAQATLDSFLQGAKLLPR